MPGIPGANPEVIQAIKEHPIKYTWGVSWRNPIFALRAFGELAFGIGETVGLPELLRSFMVKAGAVHTIYKKREELKKVKAEKKAAIAEMKANKPDFAANAAAGTADIMANSAQRQADMLMNMGNQGASSGGKTTIILIVLGILLITAASFLSFLPVLLVGAFVLIIGLLRNPITKKILFGLLIFAVIVGPIVVFVGLSSAGGEVKEGWIGSCKSSFGVGAERAGSQAESFLSLCT